MDYSKALQDSLAGIESKLDAIESRLETTTRHFESRLGGLEKGHRNQANAAPPSRDPELRRINQAARSMAAAESQSRVLAAYLEAAGSMASRGILFVKEDEGYSKWRSIGFDPVQIESAGTQNPSSPIIRAAADKQVVVSGENLGEAFPWVSESGESPRMSVCIPLVFGEAVPVVLYLDSSDEVPVDLLELLTHLAVLILKNQYLQQQPALQSAQGGEAVAEETVSPEPPQVSLKTEEPSAVTIEEPAPETVPRQEPEADPERTVTLPRNPAPPEAEPDRKAPPTVVESNLSEERPVDPQPTENTGRGNSQEQVSAPDPVPDLPEFTFKNVSVSGRRTSTPSEDKD